MFCTLDDAIVYRESQQRRKEVDIIPTTVCVNNSAFDDAAEYENAINEDFYDNIYELPPAV